MALRQSVALNLSPILLRIVLGSVMIAAGLPKLETTTFEGQEASRLVDLGVVEKAPVEGATLPDPQNAEPPAPQDDTPEAGPDLLTPTGPVQARMLHNITIMLDKAGHPYPVAFAWLAVITEVVGGALVIVGLLTRIWALGLAVAMAYAFYFAIYLPILTVGVDETGLYRIYESLRNIPDLEFQTRSTFFLQLSLFAAAASIFLTGPGALSLDRLLFRPRATAGDKNA